MRVAITGTTGRVGAALVERLGSCHEVIPLPRAVCDLADSESLKDALENLDCDVFINPAAITSLEACEDDPRLAMRVNSAAPGKIALWAAERGVRVIHFSTDYVFGGECTIPLTEDMAARPVNAYGRSKLAGEQAVLTHPGNLVIRVSWIFGPEKPSFVDQVFDKALANQPLAAIADKLSLPVLTTDLARWTEKLLDSDVCGILHACNPGEAVSWHGMAMRVVREMTDYGMLRSCPEIAELTLAEMTTFRARRPRFTAMNTSRLSRLIGEPLRTWPEALADHVRTRCSKFTETPPAR
jgi:dTDP-4-dehydrorhamnose reductase